MTIASQLQYYEGFSLTEKLIHTTYSWHKDSFYGSLGARIVNLTCTPFTEFIDGVAQLTLAALSLCGLSQLGWTYNFGAKVVKSPDRFPITFSGGIINVKNATTHFINIFITPILGAISPKKSVYTLYGSCELQIWGERQATLETLNQELTNKNSRLEASAAWHEKEKKIFSVLSESWKKEKSKLKNKINRLELTISSQQLNEDNQLGSFSNASAESEDFSDEDPLGEMADSNEANSDSALFSSFSSSSSSSSSDEEGQAEILNLNQSISLLEDFHNPGAAEEAPREEVIEEEANVQADEANAAEAEINQADEPKNDPKAEEIKA